MTFLTPALSQGRGKEPRWVVAFLRALQRTGKVRQAAEDAGIDHSTAYARRRTHADFAAAWAEAKQRFRAAKDAGHQAETEEMAERVLDGRARTRLVPSPGSPAASPTSPAVGGGDFIVSGGQVKRASSERWGSRKQEAYLAELAATANHRLASRAAGISYNAVLRRRQNEPHLQAACKKAIAACQARAPEFLASAMVATFDPESLPDEGINPLPKMTIDQAIKIAQMKGGGDAAADQPPDIEAVRERLEKAMRGLGLLEEEERKLAAGWRMVGDDWIPPGWVPEQGSDRAD
jgi:hypothetical protein